MIDRVDPFDHRVGLQTVERERLDAVPLEIEGTLPRELRGTLYRAGPGAFEDHGDRWRHLFDGDGLVHAIHLDDGAATYRCRFVDTSARREERAAGRRLYGGFATSGPGGQVRRFLRRKGRRNPANTHVIGHRGGLFALCEAGRPYRLDPVTLSTIGEEDLGGALPTPRSVFTAHPRRDPDTGELWGFGVEFARETLLHLYRWPLEGRPERFTSVPLPLMPMIHDFAVTATSIVVIAAPVCLPRPPLALMLGQRSFGESLRYRPELGGRIVIVDRRTGAARHHACDPFVYFHLANAHDEGDDAIVVDVCAYPDDAILEGFSTVLDGRFRRPVQNAFERLRIDRRRGEVTRRTVSAGFYELPRVVPAAEGRPHDVIYALGTDDVWTLPRLPTRIDVATGAIQRAPLAPHEWAGECVPIPRVGATSGRDTWLASVVLDARAGTSELRVLDGADLEAPPVARIRLPQLVPFGFHGSWVAA